MWEFFKANDHVQFDIKSNSEFFQIFYIDSLYQIYRYVDGNELMYILSFLHFCMYFLRKVWPVNIIRSCFLWHILIRITSLHGYILSYWSICSWLQADIFYHYLQIIVFLLRIMWPGNIIIFHHNFYSWLVVFYVPLIARSFTVPWEGGDFYTVPTGNRTPGRRVAIHYTTAAQHQLHT